MIITEITEQQKDLFNKLATHPLQSYEWGEFRKKTGITVIRKLFDNHAFQMTIHKIPHTPFTIGYVPKCNMPTETMIDELIKIGKQERCIFIQLEPNVVNSNNKLKMINDRWKIVPSAHPLFTRYTFLLDLTKSEMELLKNMHPKTRYNIKVAQKHNVKVHEDNSDEAFETYLQSTQETTKRQKFYTHSEQYHRLMWETLQPKMENGKWKMENNTLTAHLLAAKYQGQTLATWILFVLKDTLYYPYGASSNKHRELMASNLMMWEAILFGKKLGLKNFDMWGALGPHPDKNDPWYGFHKFKEGYGGKLVEFVGSFDLVLQPMLYQFYKFADIIRWKLLR